jgi:hypothetical protein
LEKRYWVSWGLGVPRCCGAALHPHAPSPRSGSGARRRPGTLAAIQIAQEFRYRSARGSARRAQINRNIDSLNLEKGLMMLKNEIDSFILAAKNNNIEMIKECLIKGYDISVVDEYGFSVLIESAEFGHKDLFWFLIKNKADIHIKTKENYSIIHAIGIGGDLKMLRYVEENGMDITEIIANGEQKGMTIKDYAIMSKNKKILKELLKRKLFS